MSVLQLSSMKTLRMRSSSMPHVGPLIGPNKRTLFWRCKKDASEREYIWYPYTRGSETLPKKVLKNSSGRLSWASFYMISVHLDLLCIFFGVAKKGHSWARTHMISLHAQVRKPFQKKCKIFGTGSRSHSGPPGRSKSMAFEWIFAGRKAPSDVWPGPSRCLVVTQEVSDFQSLVLLPLLLHAPVSLMLL